mgnify:CR=1 FL=1
MLEHLKDQPADKILSLMAAYRADPRPTKVDLGVGARRVDAVVIAVAAARALGAGDHCDERDQ